MPRGPWSPCRFLSEWRSGYPVVGVQQALQALDLAPVLQRLDRIAVPDVVWLEERSVLPHNYASSSVESLKLAIDMSI